MVAIGTRINEIGTLIRDGGVFYLRRDVGGRYELELHRTPVGLIEKRVRLVGTLVGPDLVNADGVAPAYRADHSSRSEALGAILIQPDSLALLTKHEQASCRPWNSGSFMRAVMSKLIISRALTASRNARPGG
ncbi:DUF5818 domain-containing protein [Sphingomonas sp. CFBP 13706]|uniref:DUF5818 domain-containing protein n=1 Tax=Sphingomonas sp. CFBP 13706 TaxID=2775314 RepID=UPI0031455363